MTARWHHDHGSLLIVVGVPSHPCCLCEISGTRVQNKQGRKRTRLEAGGWGETKHSRAPVERHLPCLHTTCMNHSSQSQVPLKLPVTFLVRSQRAPSKLVPLSLPRGPWSPSHRTSIPGRPSPHLKLVALTIINSSLE